jgi:hypothetical protein
VSSLSIHCIEANALDYAVVEIVLNDYQSTHLHPKASYRHVEICHELTVKRYRERFKTTLFGDGTRPHQHDDAMPRDDRNNQTVYILDPLMPQIGSLPQPLFWAVIIE